MKSEITQIACQYAWYWHENKRKAQAGQMVVWKLTDYKTDR
jgi:hypothetical protein